MAWGCSNYRIKGVLGVTFERADRESQSNLVRGSWSCRTCHRTLLLPCHTPLLISNTCLKCSTVSRVTSAEHLVGIVQYRSGDLGLGLPTSIAPTWQSPIVDNAKLWSTRCPVQQEPHFSTAGRHNWKRANEGHRGAWQVRVPSNFFWLWCNWFTA